MASMPARVTVMALRMASISQGALMVRWAQSWPWQFSTRRKGYSALAAKRYASVSGSSRLFFQRSSTSVRKRPDMASAWKAASNRSTGRTRSTPLRSVISCGDSRRPVQRSARGAGGRAKMVSSTPPSVFPASRTKSWTSAPSRPVR